MSPALHRIARPLLVCTFALVAVTCLAAANKGPIRKLAYDPDAPVVDLFDGIDDGTFTVRVAPRDEFSSKVYIENTTNQPQTVQLPDAAVGVHVLPQFGLPQLPGGIGSTGSLGTQDGLGQDVGGNLQPSGNQQQFPFFGNTGNGVFSIPAESVVQLQFNTVCLSHGRPTPQARMTYVLRRVEDRVESPALQRLLAGYDPRRIDRNTMQAAAWHLTNDMSWEQLAAKRVMSIGLRARPFLSRKQLEAARTLVADADKDTEDKSDTSRVAENER